MHFNAFMHELKILSRRRSFHNIKWIPRNDLSRLQFDEIHNPIIAMNTMQLIQCSIYMIRTRLKFPILIWFVASDLLIEINCRTATVVLHKLHYVRKTNYSADFNRWGASEITKLLILIHWCNANTCCEQKKTQKLCAMQFEVIKQCVSAKKFNVSLISVDWWIYQLLFPGFLISKPLLSFPSFFGGYEHLANQSARSPRHSICINDSTNRVAIIKHDCINYNQWLDLQS